jgi:aminoglycoside phosphotransferase (APT) family kinase protein
VIDFGSITIGDPACDLVMAWTFFHGESRILFKKLMKVDQETWYRAAGWALWKAMITLVAMKDTTTPQALQQIKIIHDIVDDFS